MQKTKEYAEYTLHHAVPLSSNFEHISNSWQFIKMHFQKRRQNFTPLFGTRNSLYTKHITSIKECIFGTEDCISQLTPKALQITVRPPLAAISERNTSVQKSRQKFHEYEQCNSYKDAFFRPRRKTSLNLHSTIYAPFSQKSGDKSYTE